MTRRQKTIAFFVTLCVLLVTAAVSLNVGWILISGRRLAALVFGMVLFGLIIAGLIVYTVFLVMEIKRNEEHDSFINAVTHELKTPIASIRLYLETLQSRASAATSTTAVRAPESPGFSRRTPALSTWLTVLCRRSASASMLL